MATQNNLLEGLPEGVLLFIKRADQFEKVFPNLKFFLQEKHDNIRGISLFASNTGGWMVILRRYRKDGQPMNLYATAPTPLESFFACEDALMKGKWYPDKRAEDYDPSLE